MCDLMLGVLTAAVILCMCEDEIDTWKSGTFLLMWVIGVLFFSLCLQWHVLLAWDDVTYIAKFEVLLKNCIVSCIIHMKWDNSKILLRNLSVRLLCPVEPFWLLNLNKTIPMGLEQDRNPTPCALADYYFGKLGCGWSLKDLGSSTITFTYSTSNQGVYAKLHEGIGYRFYSVTFSTSIFLYYDKFVHYWKKNFSSWLNKAFNPVI